MTTLKTSRTHSVRTLLASLLIISVSSPSASPAELIAVWTKKNPTAVGSSAYIGQSWLDSQGLPAENSWFPMTFDSKRNLSVAFGGGKGGTYTNDLWHYNYQQDQWILVEPHISCPNSYTWPDGRDTHGMIYDNLQDLYWTFGGSPSRFCTLSGDLLDAQQYSAWYYNPNNRTWGFVRANQGYFSHFNPGFAFSPDHNFITVFGGEWIDNSLWTIDVLAKRWNQLIPPSAPGSPPITHQIENAMVYDSFNKVFILFGGAGATARSTWVYNPNTNSWQNMQPVISPPARMMHAMVYDSKRHIVILNGGRDETTGNPLGDTWIYDYAKNAWTDLTPANSPPAADLHAMAYDSLNDVVVWFKGGLSGTWALRLALSGDLTPPDRPTGLRVQ